MRLIYANVSTCWTCTVHVILTRRISEFIWHCSDRNPSFVSPGDQGVHYWLKIRDQVSSVQALYGGSVTKSGNSRFYARRIFNGVCLFIINKSGIYNTGSQWTLSRP